MQKVTETWKNLFAGSHRMEFKAVINNVVYTYSDIKSASIRKAAMDKLSVGLATSATLDMVFKPTGTVPTAAEIRCYVRLTNYDSVVKIVDEYSNVIKTDDGYILTQSYPDESEWIPFGTFFIDTRETDSFGWMTITAYDHMLAAEQAFPPDAGAMTMTEAVAYIANCIGVSVDSRNKIAPYDIDSPVGIYTMREVLCGIAAASGGNFVITEDEKLRLISIASPLESGSGDVPAMKCNSLGEEVTIGKITLYPDSETEYKSGISGYEIQADCIYATQEICHYVRKQLCGVTYRPFSADTAFIDPALELFDSVEVNGTLSVLASIDLNIGISMSAKIEAPIDAEVNHEYPYQSRSREERKNASSISQIKKTTEQIAISVEGKVDDDDVKSIVNLNLNSLELSYSAKENGASITLSKDGVEISGDVKIGSIDASEISVNNLNADNITAGELSADHIKLGGDMDVFQTSESEEIGGKLGYYTGDDSGIHMESANGRGEIAASQQGSKVRWGYNQISVTSNGAQTNCPLSIGGSVTASGSVAPVSDGVYQLGYSDYRWATIYATTGSIVTSDKKQKKDISYDISRYDELFWRLKPASYRLVSGESGRIHTGLIAQDVEAALAECNITGDDFAAFVKNENGYGLRYEEFVSLCVRQIQILNERVKYLEGKING